MVNRRHLEKLKQGVQEWNAWRGRHPEIPNPDLSYANLCYMRLEGANLAGARLNNSTLTDANLAHANLSNATLIGSNLTGVKLNGADLTNARLGYTVFAHMDLNSVKGLEKAIHTGPSIVDRSSWSVTWPKDKDIYDHFWGGVSSAKEFKRSCFISYSSLDQAFVDKLNIDLSNNQVDGWVAPANLEIGAPLLAGIDEAIRSCDKFLLVVSRFSAGSQWVEKEVNIAIDEKGKRNQPTFIVPIRIDRAVCEIKNVWPSVDECNVGDFTRWQEDDEYQTVLNRLLDKLTSQT